MRQVAGPPLIDRPICADFDLEGFLYVAESSGTNDPVKVQLEQKPHRIVRLEDRDGDGVFDHRTVFADRMMFPEGVLCHAGSVYVAAPPAIWKLTDTDGDGVADRREVWFDGKTLTGCANDLHGPYLGRDGWIYWCKGAFAEQSYEVDGRKWKTRAAHIFRRKLEGGPIEAVMSGGMDNPVEVAFTPEGERIFTTTFLQHPRGGKRDGLIHAVWGGLYGKRHSVLDGHPRTGDLLPPLVHLGAAAPCGLTMLESTGHGMQGDLLACSFNMHKVTRHKLRRERATFSASTEDWLVSDNVDFHPTDVLEDADGSILVVNTGGWYKLCCPTSHLWKPDILGAIYRIERDGAPRIDDPRGKRIDWKSASTRELAIYLGDQRPVVRRRAAAELGRRTDAVPTLQGVLTMPDITDAHRREVVWSLIRSGTPAARQAIVTSLRQRSGSVRLTALQGVSLLRIAEAESSLRELLHDDDPMIRRLAVESMGRIGSRRSVPSILHRLPLAADRVEQHALIYALLEIADVDATRKGLAADEPLTRAGAAIALAQMGADALQPNEVLDWIVAESPSLREAAMYVVQLRPQWQPSFAKWLDQQLRSSDTLAPSLRQLIADQATSPVVQEVVQKFLTGDHSGAERQAALLKTLAPSRIETLPASWGPILSELLLSESLDVGQAVVELLDGRTVTASMARRLWPGLVAFAADRRHPTVLRLRALAVVGENRPSLKREQFEFVLSVLRDDGAAIEDQLAAVAVLREGTLSVLQRRQLVEVLSLLPPMPLKELLGAFARTRSPSEQVGVVARLAENRYVESLPASAVRTLFTHPSGEAKQALESLARRIDTTLEAQQKQLDELLARLPKGNIERGYAVFFSRRTACSTCHSIGYLGGDIGPDLTRVGQIRTERDLLEAIVFPSASFVRSFEPVLIQCADGRVASGIIRDQSPTEIVLATAADRIERVARDNVEELVPGRTSIMPAGFEKLLTPQELADLVAFLKNAR